MFSTRRDRIAWVLLILVAIGWTSGLYLICYTPEPLTVTEATMWSQTQGTISGTSVTEYFPQDMTTNAYYIDPSRPTTEPEAVQSGNSGIRKLFGFVLCFAALAAAVCGVFVLRQTAPVFGPDGAAVLLAITGTVRWDLLSYADRVDIWLYGVLTLLVLCAARELWSWLCSRFSLNWCAVHRLAGRCATPQLSLLIFTGWIALAVIGLWLLSYRYTFADFPLTYLCILACGTLGVCCLWQYGKDLQHFHRQLDHFREGLPIQVKDGAFARTEAQLLDIQAQHEEAVRTAVTSERFKVELISNVSHDLRTPLTSILGYGELLEKEALSPAGQEQLSRLNQKAGYMRDLVESLFELTKVSSGVLESKQESIDLIRLLEQTVGLFDDQLRAAGLTVRRRYEAQSVPVITDGARMHQVFANLLGNAIKYALPGTRIHLQVRQIGQSCQVRMVNTASYEMDFQPEEILQRFARGDKARSTQGSGLGLAIAQTYTESVGGSFRVQIDADQFSAIVELPTN